MEHGHPGASSEPVPGRAEQEVLLDGHVADERQDEQRHAEHDEPERAGDAHHPASSLLHNLQNHHQNHRDQPRARDGGAFARERGCRRGGDARRLGGGVSGLMSRAERRGLGGWFG